MKKRLRRLAITAGAGLLLLMTGCGHHQSTAATLPPAPAGPQAATIMQQGVATVNATPGLSDAEKARRIAILRSQFGGARP